MWFLLLSLVAPAQDLEERLSRWVEDPAQRTVMVQHLAKESAAAEAELSALGEADALDSVIAQQVELHLARLAAADIQLSPEALQKTVLDYEVWKAKTYITSGVFPKCYFGYVDGLGDTAAWEARLQHTTRKVVASLNLWSEASGSKLRITEAEVIVTFLAEGGALVLTDRKDLLSGMHPVFDIGLDHVALGLRDLPELRDRIDRDVGTHLDTLVGWADRTDEVKPYSFEAHKVSWVPTTPPPGMSAVDSYERWLLHDKGETGPYPYLRRYMSFDEAVAGTAVMLLWEKQIAQRKLEESGQAPLWTRPADEQFIIGSLVYNSGLLHSRRRWDAIRTFSAGSWMWEASEKNAHKRPRLELSAPPQQLQELQSTRVYRQQWTSWLAGYHVLQRYGGYVGLLRYSGRFDESGRIRELLPLASEEALRAELPK